ncbi:hypothetical protein ACHAWF_003948 [Thalassiosira exigua]
MNSPYSTSLPTEDVLDNIYAYSHSFSPTVDRLADTPASSCIKSDIASSKASALDSVWSGVDDLQTESHLSIPQQLKIALQQPPGIKFVAHGTKCRPRPVWITLHCEELDTQTSTPPEYRNCLTWRAEMKSSSARKSSVTDSGQKTPRMGNLRKVAMVEILGIELGKRTTALRRVQTAKTVKESDCFSLLTKTGTLDLECTGLSMGGSQHTAKEVRAAFITCLAMALSSKGLRLNGLQFDSSPASLESQLQGLGNGSAPSTGYWEERTLFSGLLSEGKTISTVSF